MKQYADSSPDVFISHSSDDMGIVEAVCAQLEELQVKCWYAPRDIPPGYEWAAAIMEAISRSRVMVLIFSEKSSASQQVFNEITAASNARCPVIPLKIDDTELKGSFAYYLQKVHWFKTTNPLSEEETDQFCRYVKNFLTTVQNHKSGEDHLSGREDPYGEDDTSEKTDPQTNEKRNDSMMDCFHNCVSAVWNHRKLALFFMIVVVVFGKWVWDKAKPSPPEIPVVMFQNVCFSERLKYTAFDTGMVSLDRQMFLALDMLNPDTLILLDISSGSALARIPYHQYRPQYTTALFSSVLDYVYFLESDENGYWVKIYDLSQNQWKQESGIRIYKQPSEIIMGGFFSNLFLENEKNIDGVDYLLFDTGQLIYTRVIRISPDGTWKSWDISGLSVREIIGTVEPGYLAAVAWIEGEGRIPKLIMLDSAEYASSEIATWGDYPDSGVFNPRKDMTIFSEDQHFLHLSFSYGNAIRANIWDLSTGKVVFSRSFPEGYQLFFKDEQTILYYRRDDNTLHQCEIGSAGSDNNDKILLDSKYFVKEDTFPYYPYVFYYVPQSEICFFLTGSMMETKGEKEFHAKIIATDLNGKICAVSNDLHLPFGDHSVRMELWDGLLLAVYTELTDEPENIQAGDSEAQQDPFHVHTVLYYADLIFDENGKVAFS